MKKQISLLSREDLLHSLEDSYAVLKSVVESPKEIVIFALDCNYKYLVFNMNHCQTMKKIWGVTIELNSNMLDYIKSDNDREKAKNNFDRTLKGESFVIEEEYGDVDLNRRFYENNYNPIYDDNGIVIGLTIFLTDITERKRLEFERNRLIEELQENLDKVKLLSGMLPVCGHCKKIRDDRGYWNRIEDYIRQNSEAEFTHSICPECLKEQHPKTYERLKKEGKI
ncbi:PAS domain-containing protein [Desulfogranum marinum]|uniref:PAS domain-containing protein n=1 Tax=Desulfogranum marinum TaxID=453220 RepID=UPI0029C9A954|nr:PAS domain-containing protein [Desulfogranum marinum]